MHTFEEIFERRIAEVASTDDPAHDLLHFKRVVSLAKHLCAQENGDLAIVVPAAWLHDLVIVPKNDPRRSQASQLSAKAAIELLREVSYPEQFLADIAHAIEAHSFSANIPARTLEAQIVQDADRLDGLGAIGIARCFATAGILKRPFYSDQDPFCVSRQADDQRFTVDHFYAKLFKTAQSLQTQAGRAEGINRAERMKKYLADLEREVSSEF